MLKLEMFILSILSVADVAVRDIDVAYDEIVDDTGNEAKYNNA